MSEYQYVGFRAIDAPVSEKNLEYMHRQSTRAEITPWSFDNEYEYGDFRGNAVEMLRRGYDFHLHYANFGVRTLLIRLPQGLPDGEETKSYFGKNALKFSKDKQGPGGTLVVEPFHEPGELEEIWDLNEWIDRLAPLRAEIIDGDPRPLYLAHLAVCSDGNHDPEETPEGPTPAGLGSLSSAQQPLVEFYELDEAWAGAARESPVLAPRSQPDNDYESWLSEQDEKSKNAWLAKLLADPQASVRAELLAKYRASRKLPGWSTVRLNRTIAQLRNAAAEVPRKAAKPARRKRGS